MFFKKSLVFCAICNKQLQHKYKPKKNWSITGYLCNNCYLNKLKIQYDDNNLKNCVCCQKQQVISDMWEPRWEWNIEGALCENCFAKKENDFQHQKNFCGVCDKKLGFIRYNPKAKWKIQGQLCKLCWNNIKLKHG